MPPEPRVAELLELASGDRSGEPDVDASDTAARPSDADGGLDSFELRPRPKRA